MDLKEKTDLRDLWVLQDLLDPKDPRDQKDQQEDPRDLGGLKDSMVVVVYLEKRVIRGRKETKVQEVFREFRVQKETKAYRVLKGPKDQWDRKG